MLIPFGNACLPIDLNPSADSVTASAADIAIIPYVHEVNPYGEPLFHIRLPYPHMEMEHFRMPLIHFQWTLKYFRTALRSRPSALHHIRMEMPYRHTALSHR
ncbi:hypothetical protein [Olivibacter ginsenosidimutans]|uniref:hypothetical protein n=1 Tax=Olivibacter ginsenosidimutans TaxID=1176537 RepID=UPI0031EFCED3